MASSLRRLLKLNAEHDVLVDISDAENVSKIVEKAAAVGIRGFFSRKKIDTIEKRGARFYFEGDEPYSVKSIVVKDEKDIEKAIIASEKDIPFVAVKCIDWKIIPLENMIAEFRRRGKKLYAFVEDDREARVTLSILERGVDGIIISPAVLDKPDIAKLIVSRMGKVNLRSAEITSISDIGEGERVCIDTVSILGLGEGMLVGSRSNFFFFVHSETIEGKFVPTRPFRVNAGAVHSYILTSMNETNYLSELEAGKTVLAVDIDGNYRSVAVGRSKIERRPLIMIKAFLKGCEETGSIVLQKAETIRLVNEEKQPVAVTELKEGDKVLVYAMPSKGRHIGKEVDELIIER
jgi:3-dehydroquinate synthase II